MNRRHFLFPLPAAVCFRLRAESQPGWQLQILRVDGLLEVRVGGPKGILIKFEGKGDAEHTWKTADGAATLDISKWVAERRQFRLWARVSGESPYCEMDILYREEVQAHWKFTTSADDEIKRPSE